MPVTPGVSGAVFQGSNDPDGRTEKARKWNNTIDGLQTAVPIQIGARGEHVGGRDGALSERRLENEFPARYFPRDPRDQRILDKEDAYEFESRKAAKAAADGRGNVVVNRTVTENDIDYLQRKRENLNLMNYETWKTQAIDLSDPTQGKKQNNPKKRKRTNKTTKTKKAPRTVTNKHSKKLKK